MAFFLGAGGVKGGASDVWKPKRTLHDWGKSEYRIIRNWTPRERRERELPIPHPLSSSPSSPLPPLPTVELSQNLTASHEPTPSIHQSSLSTKTLLPHDASPLSSPTKSTVIVAERTKHTAIFNEVRKDFSSLSQRQVKTTRKGKRRTSKGQRKSSKPGSVSIKLWEPKHISRTAKHLGELDNCVTVYDEALRETLDCTDSRAVKTMLIDHWKYTQKHMLAVVASTCLLKLGYSSALYSNSTKIRDVHTVLTLEQLVRKEKARHCVLQKELLAQLKAMRRANKKFQVAAEKAKLCKQVEEVSV